MDSIDKNDRYVAFADLYDEIISKFGMRCDLDKAKYGRTTDMVIYQNLFILCPNVEYELSRNKNIRCIITWLKKYNDYGMILFEKYKERLNLETKLIIDNLGLIEKTMRFDMNKMNMLPVDILNIIWSYLPMKEKGICILESEWSNTCDRLMKLKQKELVILTQKMKQYYSNIYNRWIPGQYTSCVNRESFYRIQELEKDYVYNMKKMDIIAWIRNIIVSHLEIELRNRGLRDGVIRGGYNSIILLYIYLKKKENDRLLLEKSRKSIKKEKRRERAKRHQK